MALAFEAEQKGKRQSWANIVANVVAAETPYTSMLEKRDAPKQVTQNWQAKSYPITGHKGVVDGKDATEADHNPRVELRCNVQKTWRKPGVSDFADESEIVEVGKGEMAEQTADAIIIVKQQIEKRCMSNEDNKADNGTTQGNETRGAFSWISNTAQVSNPVPDGYRTPAASILSGALADFSENGFLAACRSSYKQRRSPFKMHGFVGVDLKAEFSNFSKYVDDEPNSTPVRHFNQDAYEAVLVHCVDKLKLDTGEIDLHLSSYLWTTPETGAETEYTHRSAFIIDMDKAGIAFSRAPRVVNLPYMGGSKKAIVDAIFIHQFDNPLGAIALKYNSAKFETSATVHLNERNTLKIHPLSQSEQAEYGATHRVTVDYADLTTATVSTAQNLSVPVANKMSVRLVTTKVSTPFANSDDATNNSTTVTVGDSGSANRFLTSQELNANGAPVIVQEGVQGSGGQKTYTADDNLLISVTPKAGTALSSLNQGVLQVYLKIVDGNPSP